MATILKLVYIMILIFPLFLVALEDGPKINFRKMMYSSNLKDEHDKQENNKGQKHLMDSEFEGGKDYIKIENEQCFRCGELGHYAFSCTSSEKLCFKCKKPGHLAKDCKSVRDDPLVNAAKT